MKSETTEELLRIVGAERTEQPANVVAAAEAELARRTADEEELFRRKVRRSGTICAFVGGLFVVWGLLMALLGMTMLSSPEAELADEPFLFRHFDVIYVGGAFLQAVAGAILLTGGLALRKLRRRGRILILSIFWLGFAFIVVFTLEWVRGLVLRSSLDPFMLMMAAAGIVNAAFWGFLLWLPYRFFTSARVRATCGG